MCPQPPRAALTAALLSLGLALSVHSLAAPLTYRVQRGDTAYSVARRFGLTVDALLAMNGLQSPALSAGQTLTLDLPTGAPTPRTPVSAPVPVAGASPFVVAAPQAGHVRLVPEGGASLTPPGLPTAASAPLQPQPTPAQASAPTTAQPGSYQVQRGDTAYSVSRRFGMSVNALMAQNSLQESGLKVGQVLSVGGGTTTPITARPSLAQAPRPAPANSGPLATVKLPPIQAAQSQAAQAQPAPVQTLVTQAPPTSAPPSQPSSIVVTPLTPQQISPLPPGEPAQNSLPQSPEPTPAQTPSTQTANLGDPVGLALLASGPVGSVRERVSHLLGVPYLYGGTSAQGVDCSGLVVQVFTGMGISLPRRSLEQYGAGTAVDRTALSEGDLVFFDTEGRGQVSHVGIYVGQDYFVHANSYDGRVTVNRLSERYYDTRYLGARRVMGPPLGTTSTATSRASGSR